MQFSVVIATHNRATELARCLTALGLIEFHRDEFEVIIVNDGGTIAPAAAFQSLAPGIAIRILTQRNAGPGAARNTGANAANGEFVAFIDDDCIPPRDWLSKLSNALRRAPDAMVGGQTVNTLTSNPCSRASQSLVDYVYHFYNTTDSDRSAFFASNNMALSVKSLQAIGGFDECFRTAEDRELCSRWKTGGGRFYYAPDVVMYHAHDLNLLSMFRQHFGYGRGALPYWKKTGRGGLKGIRVEPISFYAGMLRYPFEHGEPRPAVTASLILFSQLSNAAGFAVEAVSSLFARKAHRGVEIAAVPSDAAAYRAPGPL